MIDVLVSLFVIFLLLLLFALMGWMFIDMCCPNLFRGIKLKLSIKGCIDFIKAIYNMETR